MLRSQNEKEYRQFLYTKDLRKAANGLGLMLLTMFVIEMAVDLVLEFWKQADQAGFIAFFSDSDIPIMLFNGLLSVILFFVVGGLYVLLEKRSLSALFPFEKIGAKKLSMLCVIGIALSLMCNIAPNLLTEVFGLFGLDNSGGDISFGGTLPNILLYYLIVAVMPAFTEEFAFRGVVMGSLRKYSDSLALVVSSAAFALMHGNFVQIPFTFCCGLVFGFMVLKTNSLLPSIIIHFLNNGLSVTFDLLYEYQVMSIEMVNLCYGAIIVITGALALVFIRKFANSDEAFFHLNRADDVVPYRQKLKTTASSPFMICYAVLLLLYAVYQLMQPYLIAWGVIGY